MLARYIAAHDRGDLAALAALLREDVRLVMPPFRGWYEGRATVVRMAALGFDPAFGHLRGPRTGANRQPAVAWYLRRPNDAEHRPLALDVLRIEDGRIAEITTFASPGLFSTFGLPPTLAAP
jgi:RNA polymerase sigma-70 factor (ECF subfamily)